MPSSPVPPPPPRGGRPARAAQTDPYAVFRPRRGRLVASVAGVVAVLIFGIGAFTLPGNDPLFGGWRLGDRLMLVACGLLIGGLMWRYATIRAVPSREGLVVRNLVVTRRLEWTQIVRVSFGAGAPWVSVELDDTDVVAVMAIQRADGPSGKAEAGRLSALVQAHSGSDPRPR